MSEPAPPEWPRRVIVVGDDDSAVVRGRSAEFLHVGIALTRVPTAIAALVALADAKGATVLAPTEPPGMGLADFRDIVDGLGGTTVVLTTADLPVTPTRLASVLDVVVPRTSTEAPVHRCGELELDAWRFRVSWHGRDVRLSPSSFELLEYLMAASPRTVSLGELAKSVVSVGSPDASDRVRARVRRIREQLKMAVPEATPPLQTVTGVGYRVIDESSVARDHVTEAG